MLTSFALPIGSKTVDLEAATHELLSRCILELEEKFYGFNIVAVDVNGFAKHEIDKVISIMQSVDWHVEYHDFSAGDTRGLSLLSIEPEKRRVPQLWFSSSDATSPGFNHFQVNGIYTKVLPRCPKSILFSRHKQLQKLRDEAYLIWPKPEGSHSLTKKQRVLYRRCIKALHTGYLGFYHVPVDLQGATEVDQRAIRTYFAHLGFGLDSNYGFYTCYSFGPPKALEPWQADGPYVGRPEQMLKIVCQAAAARAAALRAAAPKAETQAADIVEQIQSGSN